MTLSIMKRTLRGLGWYNALWPQDPGTMWCNDAACYADDAVGFRCVLVRR